MQSCHRLHNYEIIKTYPDDKYLPSYLIYTEFENQAIHALVALDEKMKVVTIVTAYHPSPDKWEHGFKKRKTS